MIELRGFQPELERKIYDAWDSGQHNVMAVAPTGGARQFYSQKYCMMSQGHLLPSLTGKSWLVRYPQHWCKGLGMTQPKVTHINIIYSSFVVD